MKLAAETFKQIISTLRSDGGSGKGHENRVEGRVGLRSSVEIIPFFFDDKGPKSLTVSVRDLSVNGIGLVSSVHLSEGVEFDVRFTRDKAKPFLVRYKVRHCKRVTPELHGIGASFVRFEDEADAKTLMGALLAKIHPAKPAAEKGTTDASVPAAA